MKGSRLDGLTRTAFLRRPGPGCLENPQGWK